jgi:O-acetyl-ADP-ribose deacetylase (regulator of RNase III)
MDSLASRLRTVHGDITKLTTSTIVNTANSSLLGGGGVDGAIHRAGGPQILAECRAIRGCRVGEAVITSGGRLPAAHVIHTVGPVWNGGHKNEPELLAACYRNSFQLAFDHKLASIAFPGISTGVYSYPKPNAAAIAVREVRRWLATHEWPQEVVLVAFDVETRCLYEQELVAQAEA